MKALKDHLTRVGSCQWRMVPLGGQRRASGGSQWPDKGLTVAALLLVAVEHDK